MDSLESVLLAAHVFAGFVGLISSVVAISAKVFNRKHAWHVKSGRVFFYAMVFVAVSAIPLALVSENTFLLLIALFSGYLAHGGWRYAKNKTRQKRGIDTAAIRTAFSVGAAMLVYAIYALANGQGSGIILAVFGCILMGFAISEVRLFGGDGFDSRQRIAMHLSLMNGSAISAFTAFMVTNVTFNPAVITWLGPTAVLTPIIIYMNRKVLSAKTA